MRIRKTVKCMVSLVLTTAILCGMLMVGGVTVSAAASKTIALNASLLSQVGSQPLDGESKSCSCFALAYARTILDGRVHAYSEYNTYGATHYTVECQWAWGNYYDVYAGSRTAVFQACINSINANTPILIHVYSEYGQHWVTVVGYQNVTSAETMTESNLLIIDPGYGYSGGTPQSLTNGRVAYTLNSSYLYVRTAFNVETTPPTISNVTVSDQSPSGYTVSCTVSDNLGMGRVRFPTWTLANDQDDLVWADGVLNGSTATFRVNVADHNMEAGTYITHIYAYDISGNYVCTGITVDNVEADSDPPMISNVEISNVTPDGYTITCNVTDNDTISRVAYPTWTLANDQDDIVWADTQWRDNRVSFRVNTADHNGEYGEYITHIYAYDAVGNHQYEDVRVIIEKDITPPRIADLKIENVTTDGYTVTCIINDNHALSKVQFPTWTEANDQDDLLWKEGSVSGDRFSFRVNRADHNNEYGTYITHIYANDLSGNESVRWVNVSFDSSGVVVLGTNIEDTSSVKGDISRDGAVTITDAVMLFQYVNGAVALSEEQLACAEVAAPSDQISITDAVHLFQYINGTVTTL